MNQNLPEKPKRMDPASIPHVTCGFDTLAGFELLQRQAMLFSSSNLVPTIYQKNTSNCAIALEMAFRMRANPLMVMQNLYIVHGTPSWSAKFLIATINTCGRYSSLDYEIQGEDPRKPNYKVRAYAIERETQRKLSGEWIDWPLVKEEGWDSKKGSKWVTMPGQMFRYRAAAFWQRAYCPEIGMGLLTAEEAEDMQQQQRQEREVRYAQDAMEQLRGARLENNVYTQQGNVNTDTGEVTDAAASSDSDAQFEKAESILNELKQKSLEAAYEAASKGAE